MRGEELLAGGVFLAIYALIVTEKEVAEACAIIDTALEAVAP